MTWRNMAWTYIHENGYCDGMILNEKQVVETLNGPLFLVKGIKLLPLWIGNRKGLSPTADISDSTKDRI